MLKSANQLSRCARLCLLSVLLGLAGCAVLTVDVDVYKGPLSNDEKVQTEQVAAMAMGAKPLLIRLRDMAEEQWDINNAQAFARTWDHYNPGFIPPEADGKSRLTNALAVRVNGILSLYEDRGSGERNALLTEAKKALEQCQKAYRVYYRSHAEDMNVYDQFVSKFSELNKPAASTAPAPVAANPASSKEPNFRELAQAYQRFFLPTNELRKTTNIFGISNVLNGFDNAAKYFNGRYPPDCGGSAMFLALQDTNLLWHHATILLPNDLNLQTNFVAEVQKLARSFTHSREALARLWRLSLGLVAQMGRDPTNEPDGSEKVRLAVSLAANLVEVKHLHFMLRFATNTVAPPSLKELRSGFESNLPALWIDTGSLVDALTNRTGAAILRSAMECALRREPLAVATELAFADDYFVHGPSDKASVGAWGKLNSDYLYYVRRQYGLAPGPLLIYQEAFRDLATLEGLLKAISGPAEGFGSGRLNEGLQTMIENYLQSAHDYHKSDHEVLQARQRLLDGLVVFAEKVKFIADSQALVSHRSGVQEWLTYSGEILTYPLTMPLNGFTWANKSISRGHDQIFNQTDDYERARPYTLVLQAVGNSIISLVDEITQRTAHNLADTREARYEWRGLTNAADFLSKEGGRLGYLATNLPPAQTAKQALDMLITELRDVRLSATAVGDTNAADRAKAAIDLALTYRADHVYIRPPSAYLRNSYPATSLQPNANVAWRNMLDRHALRSLPLFGETFANWGMDLNTIQEIDKQYWQNINRVRVAGVGITSYAITKDDIGNWYVKSYTGDPTPIIEGAKHLAMSSLPVPVPAKGAPSLLATATPATNVVPQPSLLEHQFAFFADRFALQTSNDASTVFRRVSELTNRLSQVLTAATSTASANLSSNANTLISTASNLTSITSNLISLTSAATNLLIQTASNLTTNAGTLTATTSSLMTTNSLTLTVGNLIAAATNVTLTASNLIAAASNLTSTASNSLALTTSNLFSAAANLTTTATNLLTSTASNLVSTATNVLNSSASNLTSAAGQLTSFTSNLASNASRLTGVTTNLTLTTSNLSSIAASTVTNLLTVTNTPQYKQLIESMQILQTNKAVQTDALGKNIVGVLRGLDQLRKLNAVDLPDFNTNSWNAWGETSNRITAQLNFLIHARMETLDRFRDNIRVLSESLAP